MGGLITLILIIFAPVILLVAYALVYALVGTIKNWVFPDRPEWARVSTRLAPEGQFEGAVQGSGRSGGAGIAAPAGSAAAWSAQRAGASATDSLYEQMADQREAGAACWQHEEQERWQREEDEHRRQKEEDDRRYWEQREEDDRRYYEEQRRQQEDDYYRRQRDGY